MMSWNVSRVAAEETASTCFECARQRAENFAALNVRSVLELCVGPSLSVLEAAYREHEITVAGNDVDLRWKKHYPHGKWIMGDALSVPHDGFDAVVFAPPLSKGCTGTRSDSLQIDDVLPKYRDFLSCSASSRAVRTLVLPGRALATQGDRRQFHALMSRVSALNYEVVPLRAGRRRIVKYYDVYLC